MAFCLPARPFDALATQEVRPRPCRDVVLDREQLLATLFASQIALLASERNSKRPPDDSHQRRVELCRRLTRLRVHELLASKEARSLAEARYLDGHSALFPDISGAFEEQLRDTKQVAAMAVRAAELDGVEPASPEDPDALTLRAGQLVADLVEPAKTETLDKLGEGRQALDIAAGWVRKKLASTPVVLTRREEKTGSHSHQG